MQIGTGTLPDGRTQAEVWEESKKTNKYDTDYVNGDVTGDAFGACIIHYAEQWADEMEKRIANGETVEQCARECERIVDKRPGFGITGFMYGAAVTTLAHVWVHGDALRKWHNAEWGVKEDEAKGGTVNPAMFTIKLNDG